MSRAYLDFNATAPLKPEAKSALVDAMGVSGNPSSTHQDGQAARRLIETARAAVASLVGRPASEVTFTSGATEANNLVISGLLTGRGPEVHILTSAIEHPSVLDPAQRGRVQMVPVTEAGVLDLDALRQRLTEIPSGDPALVSIMAVNNETGVIQPIEEAAAIAHEAGALFHSDCVQAAPHLDLKPSAAASDFITLSAHKLGGPRGVGALVACGNKHLEPMMRGGGQEKRQRSGTEALELIASFGAVCAGQAHHLANSAQLNALKHKIEAEIATIAPMAVIAGVEGPRAPHTSNIILPGVSSEIQVMSLDLAGVSVSAGSACSSGKIAPSAVLTAMGFSDAEAGSAIRVSLGWSSTEHDVDHFLTAYSAMVKRLG